VKPGSQRLAHVGCRRLAVEREHGRLKEHVRTALADEIRCRVAGRAVMIAIKAEIAFPGAQDLRHGQPVGIDCHSVVQCGDSRDLPFQAELSAHPGPAMLQETHKRTPHMAKTQ